MNEYFGKQDGAWKIQIAKTLEEATSAWKLVYREYLSFGFIDPNKNRTIYPSVINKNSLVLFSSIYHVCIATITCTVDNGEGSGLDDIFTEPMNDLKKDGKVMDISMFASVRGKTDLNSLSRDMIDFMRYSFSYAYNNDISTVVMGVNPSCLDFYCKIFNFKTIGDIKKYPKYNNIPVGLIYTKPYSINKIENSILRNALTEKVDKSFFNKRHIFDPSLLKD